jgi:Flp pilus assembly protein TadG
MLGTAEGGRGNRFGARRGASVLEMALILPLLLLVIFGALTVSLTLNRDLSALQVTRYAGSLYARGTDFSVASNVGLLLKGAGDLGITSSGGRGVVYLSTVVKAAPGTANANKLVVAERFVIGNRSLASSRTGTPSTSIWPDRTKPLPNGQVKGYEDEPSAVATLPAAFAGMALDQRVYVIEVCYSLSDLGGWSRLLGKDQVYHRAFF